MKLTYADETDFAWTLAKRYIEKALDWEEQYTVYDAVTDIKMDPAYLKLEGEGKISITDDELANICIDSYKAAYRGKMFDNLYH
jgi:hypothetical protein